MVLPGGCEHYIGQKMLELAQNNSNKVQSIKNIYEGKVCLFKFLNCFPNEI
jgi:hypothetical protein